MLKISHAGCFGLSLAISSQFTVEMCAATKKSTKISSMLTNLKSACYDIQQVCTYLQPFSRCKSQQWQNNVFLEGTPLWRPRSRKTPSTRDTKFCH